MTSNPVALRASESQDEAKPLLDEAEQKCDEVVEAIGFGNWSLMLVILLGFLFMGDSIEATLLSFLYDCVGGAFDPNPFEASTVISIVFAGEIVGAAFAGPIADQYWRKGVSLASGFFLGIFGLASAFSDRFDTFIALRFFVGVGIGTNPIPYDLLAEQIPASMRGRVLMSSSIFWAIGTLYTVGAAWITLPIWSWRSLAVACALPPLIVAFALLPVLNESPRWLLEEERREEAAAVLRQLAKRNDKADDKAVDAAIAKVAEGGDDASVSRGFDFPVAWKNFMSLFDARRLCTTVAVWIVWFSFGLLYYGMTLLVTRSYVVADDDDSFTCRFNYTKIFATFTSELVGALLLFATIDVFGRVTCGVVSYTLTALFLIPVALEASGTFVWLYLALAFATAASSTSWVHITELYSTDVRSTAHTLVFIVGRFGGFASGYVVENGNSIAFATTVLIIASAVSAAATLTLRETMGERLT